MSNFDILLYREIKNGKQYDTLIPKTTCKSTYLGDGMTDFSVQEMASMVQQYAFQMEKVAPLLSKSSLQQTCNTIHKWCYDHFQYKADDEIQYLRSPACSWYSRYDGIDCKSYSIVASCILINLGINHYIRRIKQPGFMPDLWTHVYVIVPKDQEKGNLNQGYYVIDGTVATTVESAFIQNSDTYISMKHYGLNGAHPQQGMNGLLDGVIDSIPGGNIANNLLKGLSFNTIKNLFAGGWAPSCINGSLNTKDFEASMANIVPAFETMFNDVNLAIGNGDNLLGKINKVFRVAAQIKSHSELKAGGNWKSKCSRDAVNMYKELGNYYYHIVYTGFQEWLKYYFNITTSTVSVPNNTFDIPINFDKGSDIAQVQPLIVTSLTPKSSTTNVKQFVLNSYVGNNDNLHNFNINQFLSGISNVVASFNSSNTGSGTNNGNGNGNGTVVEYPQQQTVQKAGFSGVFGVILFAAGAAYLFKNMPDKPKTLKAVPIQPTSTKKLSK